MKIENLRIGNFVGYKNRTDFYAEVTELSQPGGIHLTRYFTDGNIDDQPEEIKYITGLNLTEEWLIKLGCKCEELDGGPVGFYNSYSIGVYELSRYVENMWGIIDMNHKPLIYVHQFQNLIFALTGEELIIK